MSKILLKEVVTRVKDKVDKDNTELEYYVGGEHFDNGEVVISKRGILSGSTIGPAFHMKFEPGDVLLMSRNPHLRKAGVVNFEGICSDVSYVCRTKNENTLLQRFLPFVFQTDQFWSFAEENKKGSTNFFLNWSDFEKYEFELPSLEKQRRFSEMLWAIEDTLQAYKKLLNETDNMVRSQFIEMFGTPKENTKGFAVGKIGDVVSDVHYGTSSKASDSGDYTYLRMNNISYEGELDLSETKRITVSDKELKGCLVKKGDVIFNRTNSRDLVGKTCAFSLDEPMVIAGYLIRLRLNGKVLPEYLATFMNLKSSKKMLMTMAKGAVGQANINSQEVQSIELVIPPLELQEEFVVLLDQSNKSKCVLKDAISALEATKKSLMRDTFGC